MPDSTLEGECSNYSEGGSLWWYSRHCLIVSWIHAWALHWLYLIEPSQYTTVSEYEVRKKPPSIGTMPQRKQILRTIINRWQELQNMKLSMELCFFRKQANQ